MRTAQEPIFGPGTKPCGYGIHCGVVATAIQIFVVADQVIVRLDLPEACARPIQKVIRFPRRKAFPTLQNLTERPSGVRTHDNMDVIRHHDPGRQIETRAQARRQVSV